MRIMENIIKDIEDLRNNRAGEQHGYFCIGDKPTEDDLCIDTLDICRALTDYEVDYNMADEDELPDGNDEYGWGKRITQRDMFSILLIWGILKIGMMPKVKTVIIGAVL